MKVMFTTGEVAELLSIWADAPGGYTADFVRGEIDDERLFARVNSLGTVGSRQRRRIRVHKDELIRYVQAYHPLFLNKANEQFAAVAA